MGNLKDRFSCYKVYVLYLYHSITDICPDIMDGKAIDIFSHPTPAGLMTNSIDGKNMPELKYPQNSGPISLKVHPKGNSNKSEFAMYQLTIELKSSHRIQAIRAQLEDKSEMLIIPPKPVVSYKKVDK